jgi:hypothetical protein
MDDKERVREHLRLLSILHYVYAGLLALGSCGGIAYAGFGWFVSEIGRRSPQEAAPADLVAGMFVAIGVAMFVLLVAAAVCAYLSAQWLAAHKNRTFSMVVAAIACLSVPLGTLLGVFTLIALTKPEARELYAEAEGRG